MTQPPCLNKALSGDREALEELAATCWPIVFGYLARLSGSREAARDLTQDAMLRVLGSIESYRAKAGASFLSWVFRIARNRFIDAQRQSGREVPFPEGEDDAQYTGERDPTGHAALANAEAAILRRALERLAPADRELLELRYWYGFSHREAAAVTGATPLLVKSRLNAALGRLRKQYSALEKEHNDEKLGA